MRKSLETAVDIASTVMAGAVLYHVGAAWWAFALILLFGACQQLVGRNRGQAELKKKIMGGILVAVAKHATQSKEGS